MSQSRRTRSLASFVLALLLPLLALSPAGADDRDIYDGPKTSTLQAPLTFIALDLNLVNPNDVVCNNVLLSTDANCVEIRGKVTVGDLLTLFGLPATATSIVGGLDPLTLLSDLSSGVRAILSTSLSVGVSLSLSQQQIYVIGIKQILERLVDSRVAVVLNHANKGPAGGPCAFADLASLPGERQNTPACSNGAYLFSGLINAADPLQLQALIAKVIGGLTTTTILGASGLVRFADSPFQAKEIYLELAKYLRGDRIYNGHLGYFDYGDNNASDNLDSSLPVLSWDPNAEVAPARLFYKPALADFPDACAVNLLNVQLTNATGQDESDPQVKTMFPEADANGDTLVTLPELVAAAGDTSKGFVYTGGQRRAIRSSFLVQDNLSDRTALNNVGANVATYTDVIGLLGRGRDIARGVVNPPVVIDAALASASLGSSRSTADGLSGSVYVPVFRPDSRQRPDWPGNIKKLKLEQTASGVYVLRDQNGTAAIDASDGRIKATAVTVWTDVTKLGGGVSTDGRAANLGGAGQKIPGFQVGGGGTPQRSNPTGTGAGRKLFFDSYTGSNGGALARLEPDDAAVRTELAGPTGAKAYNSSFDFCEASCLSTSTLCSSGCALNQTSCNNLCTLNQTGCNTGCSTTQTTCATAANATKTTCIATADTTQASCQTLNNPTACQTLAGTAQSTCNTNAQTAHTGCVASAATIRSTCTLPHDGVLTTCQSAATLNRTNCNALCLGNATCINNCTTNYNNALAACMATYNTNTAGCNSTYNNSVTSCDNTRTSSLATCTSNYNTAVANCTANFNACATAHTAAVNQCNSNHTAALAQCTTNYNSCTNSCSTTGSSCAAGCSTSATSCENSCTSSLNTCRANCVGGSSRSLDTVTRELLLYARGYDVGTYAAPKGTGSGTSPTNSGIGSRPWLMGAVLHSRPLAINYGRRVGSSDDIRVLVGSSDGYLRMLSDSTGAELWAFMPQAVMSALPTLRENNPGGAVPYGVDGPVVALIRDRNDPTKDDDYIISPTASSAEDRVLAFFGLRRGGNRYYAFDLTNPDAPTGDPCNGGTGARLLWSIGPEGLHRACTAGIVSGTESQYSALALTFATPQFGRLRYDHDGSTTTPDQTRSVLIFGGGYNGGRNGAGQRIGKDYNNSGNSTSSQQIGKDDGSGTGTSAVDHGNAIYIVDAETGALVWRGVRGTSAGYDNGTLSYRHPMLVDSIAGDATVLDTNNDGLTDRLYVGDTGGRLWRADLAGARADWTLTPVASVGRHAERTPTLAADRRIFHAPDVVPVRERDTGYDIVLFGTGDREDPFNATTVNWFYAFRDTDVISGKAASEIIIDEDSAALAQHDDFRDQTSTCASARAGSDCKDVRGLVPGYRFRLQRSGEKIFSSPLTLDGVTSFSTYVPATPSCSPQEGGARFYNTSLLDSRPVPYVNQVGSDRDSALPGGPPGEVQAASQTTQLINNQLLRQNARDSYPASWRERLGDDERPLQ